MSTYWDVRCLDCNEESGLHLNHGDDACRALIKVRDGLAGLAEFDHWSELNVSVSGEIGHVDPSFYKKHAGHVLAPVSEYGQIGGDCEKYEQHVRGYCRELKDHDGVCRFVEAMPWDPAWEAVRKAAAERRRA